MRTQVIWPACNEASVQLYWWEDRLRHCGSWFTVLSALRQAHMSAYVAVYGYDTFKAH